MNFSAIKNYFVVNAEKLNLKARTLLDISVSSYAVNQEEYGVVNIFVGDKSGFKYVLKRGRYDRFNRVYSARMASLRAVLRDDAYTNVRVHIPTGKEINVAGNDYLLFPYIDSVNAYMKIRKMIFRKDKVISDVVDSVLEFCFGLEAAGNAKPQKSSEKSVERIIKRFRDSYKNHEISGYVQKLLNNLNQNNLSFHRTLTHNDLAATNFLVGQGTYWVTDWEYWDFSFGVFNFFDIVVNFGSLMTTKVFAKRSYEDFYAIFGLSPGGPRTYFNKRWRQYAKKAGYCAYDPHTAWDLFLLYLMNKATCQYLVYGKHYGFDAFWYSMLIKSTTHRNEFRSFWSQFCERREL